jgi:F-type H+-transporting ATPase subunit b
MQIDWWTLGLQALNFLILVWLLWRFLYKPVRSVIDKRKELAEQAFIEAGEKKQEAEAARQHFEQELARQANERQKLLNVTHKQLESERSGIMEDARQEADKLIKAARETIAKERQAALDQLRNEVAELATDLAATLMQESGPELSSESALVQLEAQLKSLPANELDRLKDDLRVDNANLVIVTAAPLDSEDQSRWRRRMADCLGHNDNTDFATDPGIVGGAELHLPHTVLRFTWADQLRRAKELLRQNEATA